MQKYILYKYEFEKEEENLFFFLQSEADLH